MSTPAVGSLKVRVATLLLSLSLTLRPGNNVLTNQSVEDGFCQINHHYTNNYDNSSTYDNLLDSSNNQSQIQIVI